MSYYTSPYQQPMQMGGFSGMPQQPMYAPSGMVAPSMYYAPTSAGKGPRKTKKKVTPKKVTPRKYSPKKYSPKKLSATGRVAGPRAIAFGEFARTHKGMYPGRGALMEAFSAQYKAGGGYVAAPQAYAYPTPLAYQQGGSSAPQAYAYPTATAYQQGGFEQDSYEPQEYSFASGGAYSPYASVAARFGVSQVQQGGYSPAVAPIRKPALYGGAKAAATKLKQQQAQAQAQAQAQYAYAQQAAQPQYGQYVQQPSQYGSAAFYDPSAASSASSSSSSTQMGGSGYGYYAQAMPTQRMGGFKQPSYGSGYATGGSGYEDNYEGGEAFDASEYYDY